MHLYPLEIGIVTRQLDADPWNIWLEDDSLTDDEARKFEEEKRAFVLAFWGGSLTVTTEGEGDLRFIVVKAAGTGEVLCKFQPWEIQRRTGDGLKSWLRFDCGGTPLRRWIKERG